MSPKIKSKLAFALIMFIGFFLLLQMAVYFIHHFGMNMHHYGIICPVLFNTQEHSVIGAILSLLFAAVITRMVWQLTKQINMSRKWLATFHSLRDLTQTYELNQRYPEIHHQVLVVQSEEIFALTIGFLNPQIAISSALIKNLSENEIKAVLLHEQFHCIKRDPLKFLLIHLASENIAYIPLLKGFIHYYKSWRELLADRYAMHHMGSNADLGSVILKMNKLKGSGAQAYKPVFAHFADIAINYRILQILEPERPVRIPIMHNKRSAISLAILIANVLLLISCMESYLT